MKAVQTGLWKKEFSAAHGWRWIKMRDCDRATAPEWRAVFEADEPQSQFVISDKRPKL